MKELRFPIPRSRKDPNPNFPRRDQGKEHRRKSPRRKSRRKTKTSLRDQGNNQLVRRATISHLVNRFNLAVLQGLLLVTWKLFHCHLLRSNQKTGNLRNVQWNLTNVQRNLRNGVWNLMNRL